jgi:hypothetical protein
MKGNNVYFQNEEYNLEPSDIIIDDLYATKKLLPLIKNKLRVIKDEGYIIEIYDTNINAWIKPNNNVLEQFIYDYTNGSNFIFYQKQDNKIKLYDYRCKIRIYKNLLRSLEELQIDKRF